MKVPSRNAGFTLIDMIIAMAIMGILTALALPTYERYIQSAHRTHAKAMLLDVAGRQESLFTDIKRYSDDATDLGFPAKKILVDADGRVAAAKSDAVYELSLTLDGPYAYLAEASALNRQANDEACYVLSIDNKGIRNAKTKGGQQNTDCW